MKRLSDGIVLALIACLLAGFAILRLDGFFPSAIQGKLAGGESAPPPPEVAAILRQPWTYLAKGRQVFVFSGQDGQTVLKVFNYRRTTVPPWLLAIPWPKPLAVFLNHYAEEREKRLFKTFRSFQLAQEFLSEETALLYLHLQRGGVEIPLTLIDRGKGVHRLNGADIAFAIQKRAASFGETLRSRMRERGREGLEECLSAYLAVIRRRADLRIADDDYDAEKNFGFIGNTAILLDPGRLYLCPSLAEEERYRQEIRIAMRRVKKLLIADSELLDREPRR